MLGLIALALLIPLNRTTQLLALIGGVLAVTYPFLKRFFALPQAYLGLAFSWSVPMAFAAQTGSLPLVAWVLFAAGVLWTTAYDTIYAMVDREDDLLIGVRSSAILFGRADRGIVAVLQFGALALLALAGYLAQLGRWYWLGLATAALLSLHQQFLIRHRDPSQCFRAFLEQQPRRARGVRRHPARLPVRSLSRGVLRGIRVKAHESGNYAGSARPTDQTSTDIAPSASRACEASMTVLPVVTTSSTNPTRIPSMREDRRARPNAPRTLSARSARASLTWEAVSRVRARA